MDFYSSFFSSGIYITPHEDREFYWSRYHMSKTIYQNVKYIQNPYDDAATYFFQTAEEEKTKV